MLCFGSARTSCQQLIHKDAHQRQARQCLQEKEMDILVKERILLAGADYDHILYWNHFCLFASRYLLQKAELEVPALAGY